MPPHMVERRLARTLALPLRVKLRFTDIPFELSKHLRPHWFRQGIYSTVVSTFPDGTSQTRSVPSR
ncbi:hypothetical protein N8612_03080, partial [Verrucomicrobia bacterium]|nr:hypothetical protein [Verrucomicrobiota bacterium]